MVRDETQSEPRHRPSTCPSVSGRSLCIFGRKDNTPFLHSTYLTVESIPLSVSLDVNTMFHFYIFLHTPRHPRVLPEGQVGPITLLTTNLCRGGSLHRGFGLETIFNRSISFQLPFSSYIIFFFQPSLFDVTRNLDRLVVLVDLRVTFTTPAQESQRLRSSDVFQLPRHKNGSRCPHRRLWSDHGQERLLSYL